MPKLPLPLDYSSPAREGQEERERREALENYNLSTFGDHRPEFIGLAVVMVVLSALALVLPRRMSFVADLIGCAAFLAWRWYRNR